MSANEHAPNAITGEFLVCLADEVPWRDVRHTVDTLVATHGGTVMTILETLPGFGVRATGEQALAYAADPAVGAVEESRRTR
jgi:hypothetical protein